ncbi:hypothetical protein G4P69_12945 [Aetokthonos hydrillicola CCALA 1050]|nr:hypothetical protein [Aetokthonos hydrillicola CCALA 1050]
MPYFCCKTCNFTVGIGRQQWLTLWVKNNLGFVSININRPESAMEKHPKCDRTLAVYSDKSSKQ